MFKIADKLPKVGIPVLCKYDEPDHQTKFFVVASLELPENEPGFVWKVRWDGAIMAFDEIKGWSYIEE